MRSPESVGKFLQYRQKVAPFAQLQPSHQPERQQAAQFGAALGGVIWSGRERVGATDGTGIEHHDPSVPH